MSRSQTPGGPSPGNGEVAAGSARISRATPSRPGSARTRKDGPAGSSLCRSMEFGGPSTRDEAPGDEQPAEIRMSGSARIGALETSFHAFANYIYFLHLSAAEPRKKLHISWIYGESVSHSHRYSVFTLKVASSPLPRLLWLTRAYGRPGPLRHDDRRKTPADLPSRRTRPAQRPADPLINRQPPSSSSSSFSSSSS